MYLVCKTQSLEEMANMLPCTLEELNHINGFGAIKIKQYGKIFISIIKDFCESNGIQSNTASRKMPVKKVIQKSKKINSNKVTLDLYRKGKTIAEISKERNLAESTVEGHLTHYVSTGEIKANALMEPAKYNIIKEALSKLENQPLSSLKAEMPFATYAEIRFVMAENRYHTLKHSLSSEIIL